MNQEIEDQLAEVLPKIKAAPGHILHFSCGADSIASHLRMRELGIEPILVYMYYIDGLPLVENWISYYEKKTNSHIYKLPHPFFWKEFQNGQFQIPGVGLKVYKYIKSLGWGKYNFKTYNRVLEDNFPDYYFAQGLKASDSINRRLTIKNRGCLIGKVWYPIASFGSNDIKELLRKYDIRLPYDYKIFGRSFEGLDAWMAPILKRECPKTWAAILEYFPAINLLCGQAEALKWDIPSGATRRIKIYGDMAMDKGELIW